MSKKNLIYVFADQWKKTAVGFENNDVITPNIDEFAKSALVLNNAISTYPLCSPHRAALFTGKYPYSVGMWTNCKIGLDEVLMLKPQEITLGKVLKEEGYKTGYIGKWHLDASEMNFSDKPASGAVGWDAYTPEGERRQGFDFWYSYGAMDNHLTPHYWANSNKKIIHNKWSPEVETDIAIEFLNSVKDGNSPFCLFISWNPPHPPYDKVPSKYVDMYDEIEIPPNVPEELRTDPNYLKTVREYYGAISGLDENFGRLMRYLKENDLEKDTIIVLSADHGEMMGAHGFMGKNIWYEESILIPFMIKGEGIKPGRCDTLFSSIDHMPTLLDILNIPIPDTVHGRSILNEMNGGEDNVNSVFLSMIPGLPNLVEPYKKLGLDNKCFGWRGIRTKTHTYVVNNGTSPLEKQERLLYNLITDPYQLHPEKLDIADPRAKKFDSLLKEYLKKINDPFLIEGLDVKLISKYLE